MHRANSERRPAYRSKYRTFDGRISTATVTGITRTVLAFFLLYSPKLLSRRFVSVREMNGDEQSSASQKTCCGCPVLDM